LPVAHGGADESVQRPPERGALRGQSGEQIPIDGHDLLHALLVQPLGMCAAGAAKPAAHGRCRAIQAHGDGAMPVAVSLGHQRVSNGLGGVGAPDGELGAELAREWRSAAAAAVESLR
jgi:hypothetical protein